MGDRTKGSVQEQASSELPRNHRALAFLRERHWAKRLVQDVERQGGISNSTNEGHLFTLRFGWELALACPDANITYEFRTGVGGTSVDFRLQAGGRTWLLECMVINPSDAARGMEENSDLEISPGIHVSALRFDHSAEERGERPEAELHRVSQAIWQHVWEDPQRHKKFPVRSGNSANVLVVCMAGFMGWVGLDPTGCIEVVCGSRRLRYPQADLQGLFDGNNAKPGAVAVRERVDLLVFVDDVHGIYDDQEIRRSSYLLCNPASAPWVKAEYPVLLPAECRKPVRSCE